MKCISFYGLKHALLLMLSFLSFQAQAQRLFSPTGNHYDKSKRMVVDQAKIGAMYELQFRKDSTKVNDYTKAQTVLMISDKYLLFGDYNRLVFDSINDYMAESKRNARNRQAYVQWQEAIGKWTYFFVTLTDLAKQQTTVQTYDVLRSYEYTYATPKCRGIWKLAIRSFKDENAKKQPALFPEEIMWLGTPNLFPCRTALIYLQDCPA